jgi:hypothetical protein
MVILIKVFIFGLLTADGFSVAGFMRADFTPAMESIQEQRGKDCSSQSSLTKQAQAGAGALLKLRESAHSDSEGCPRRAGPLPDQTLSLVSRLLLWLVLPV